MTLDPAEWQTFANLVPAFSFGALEAKYGRGTAVRMSHTLNRIGLVETVAIPEEEAEWLDRLPKASLPTAAGMGPTAKSKLDSAAEPELEIVEDPIEPASVEEPEITEPEAIAVTGSSPAGPTSSSRVSPHPLRRP